LFLKKEKKMSSRLFIILFSFISIYSYAQEQETEKLIQSGNELYKQKQYEQAIVKYNEALKRDPSNTTVKYNRAIAQYRIEKEQESIKAFNELATDNKKNNEIRSKAYYNEGAILSNQQKLEQSIEAYKNALRLNPGDTEARENLQKALIELKKKNEEKPPPQPKKEKQKQQQQPRSNLSSKEAEQKLNQLEQKEKQVQQRVQQQKSRSGASKPKDW